MPIALGEGGFVMCCGKKEAIWAWFVAAFAALFAAFFGVVGADGNLGCHGHVGCDTLPPIIVVPQRPTTPSPPTEGEVVVEGEAVEPVEGEAVDPVEGEETLSLFVELRLDREEYLVGEVAQAIITAGGGVAPYTLAVRAPGSGVITLSLPTPGRTGVSIPLQAETVPSGRVIVRVTDGAGETAIAEIPIIVTRR